VLRQPGYHRLVNALPGYDAGRTGSIESLQEAFGSAGGPRQPLPEPDTPA
jgi:hypothetical protein